MLFERSRNQDWGTKRAENKDNVLGNLSFRKDEI